MHIIAFILGSCLVSAGVAAVAIGMGHSGWGAFGFAVASFVLAQMLYLVWIVWMAQVASRRKPLGQDSSTPAEQVQAAVQKG